MAFFTYSMGNDAFNYVKYKLQSMDGLYNQSTDVLQRWTSSAPTGTIPKASVGDPEGNSVFSDRWIEDASYIRLKNLTIDYTFSNLHFIKGLTLYATASNWLTITKYKGYDPEFMYMNSIFSM